MKYIPTGHDSPWIAGEALGAEEIKLRDVPRKREAQPTWKSVLAIPIYASDQQLPDFATAVITFGLSKPASETLPQQELWAPAIEQLSSVWSERINTVAFSDRPDNIN